MKLRKYKRETLVEVHSLLGVVCGSFVWPTEDLSMLDMLNHSKRGYYFKPYRQEVILNEKKE